MSRQIHLLPQDIEFPSIDALGAWRLWWLETQWYPPFRLIKSNDLSSRSKRKTYSEWNRLVTAIASSTATQTGSPVPTNMSEQEGTQLFEIGFPQLPTSDSVPHRRWSQLKVTTLLRLTQEAANHSNPNYRPVPFRCRKRRRQKGPIARREYCSSDDSAGLRTNRLERSR